MSTRPDSLEALRRRARAFESRAKALSNMRRIFEAEGFVEVETPSAVMAPAPEEYIEAPRAGELFLRTSPELQMKRLLAAGMTRIFQIGPCFRQGECGRLHRPEFTMLEWYMAHCSYLDILDFTRRLVSGMALSLHGSPKFKFRGSMIDAGAEWRIIPVREAFKTFAGECADACAKEGRFEQVLVERVEPSLPKDRPAVLIDYPTRFSAFARLKKDDPTLAERWELYLGGAEIANAYGELVDPGVQRTRFEEFSKTRREQGLAEYPEPTAFLEAIDFGVPESAGCALGVDRIIMCLLGSDDISEVSYPLDS